MINNSITAKIHYQLSADQLVQQTLSRNEGLLNDTGALVVATGEFTGRSPADKFIVSDSLTADVIDWNKFNHPVSASQFLKLREDLISYLNQRDEVWVRDACACAHPDYRLNLQVINEYPWCNHFAANMFIAPENEELEYFEPEWQIIQAPGFKAIPSVHGTRQGNFTVISFTHKVILIGGTAYTGEIKKGVFTILNFILPYYKNVLSMHCSCNTGSNGDTALFFGLSGTGKTTLSSDPSRKLVGDDEHGWDDTGIFNIEGGCYAKVINLSSEHEPDIYNAIKAGALVENTCFIKNTRTIDFSSKAITENTRVSYPLNFIKNIKTQSVSGIPANIFFLTCDAYGVFPPIGKLTNEQEMYYFINGYTAKIAGTEEGIREPQVTFSACFGAPFLPLHPSVYADLLYKKIKAQKTNVWLINTGWTGGPYGIGTRISLQYTRAMITAAISEALANVNYKSHPELGILIPQSCPGVPSKLLNPWQTWANKSDYDATIRKLMQKFDEMLALKYA